MVQARVEKKDPEAISLLGEGYFHGNLGLQKDMQRAIELWTEAAELGSIAALYSLALSYNRGEGVQQDEAKGAEFYTKAAMQGHVDSRHNLGHYEAQKLKLDHAVKHYLISAKMGDGDSVEIIKTMFKEGLATKEQYAQALRGCQDAVEEMKSPERDEVKKRLGDSARRVGRADIRAGH